MATHSSILAWKILWTEDPDGLYSPWGRKELDTTASKHSTAYKPIPELFPGDFHGQRSLMDYNPRVHKESDMTEQLTHNQRENNIL